MRKTVVLMYDMEPHVEKAYQNLHIAFDYFRSSSRCWHIPSAGRITTTYDRKVNAGATGLIKRNTIKPSIGTIAFFKTNVPIPIITAGRQKLCFLPDRILVMDGSRVGAVNYDEIVVWTEQSRFIEDGWVPPESPTVGKTWRFANVKGGPDRRFSNNREIPIVLYEEIRLSSRSGLQEQFQVTRAGVGNYLRSAFEKMDSAIKMPAKVEYAKCACTNCNQHIEFPAEGAGQLISCPHCGDETSLSYS